MSEWPAWRRTVVRTGLSASSRYLASWPVIVQLSLSAPARKQRETANLITQTDRRRQVVTGCAVYGLRCPGHHTITNEDPLPPDLHNALAIIK
jgi:hypothetical protein